MDLPRVSVIIPTCNRWASLQEAIASVNAQTYRPLQLVVVDDGSTDETPSLCAKILDKFKQRDFQVLYIYQNNQGAPAARNCGILRSTGGIIQFLDADDFLFPGKIAAQMELLATDATSARVVYGPWMLRTELQGRVVQEVVRQRIPHNPTGHGSLLAAHLAGWYCPPHAYLWTRAAVRRVGGWDESLVADQDGDYMLRALASGLEPEFVDSLGAVYRIHGHDQVSSCSSRKALLSRFRVAEKLEALLEQQGRLEEFRCALAARYYGLQKLSVVREPDLADHCAKKLKQLCAEFDTSTEGIPYRVIRSLLGLRAAQWVSEKKQSLVGRTIHVKGPA